MGLCVSHFRDSEQYGGSLSEFIDALLAEYLITERIHLKVAMHYVILKRDRFLCQVPGCRCRRNLEVHHIVWRSKGGCDEHWNLLTLCRITTSCTI
ncbi:MAG: HNH endonuclease [Vulcanimicrobiota bacterium]